MSNIWSNIWINVVPLIGFSSFGYCMYKEFFLASSVFFIFSVTFVEAWKK